MIKNYRKKTTFENTGFCRTLSLISGKHKPVTLYSLRDKRPSLINVLDPLCILVENNRE